MKVKHCGFSYRITQEVVALAYIHFHNYYRDPTANPFDGLRVCV